MQYAKLLVKLGHLLAVRRRVPAPLAVLLLLLPSLDDARFRSRQEDEPVCEAGDKGCRQRDQGAPSVGRIEEAPQTTGGSEGTTARQRRREDDRKRRLQTEVPGECLGLEVGELEPRKVLELDDGGDAGLRKSPVSQGAALSDRRPLTYINYGIQLAN